MSLLLPIFQWLIIGSKRIAAPLLLAIALLLVSGWESGTAGVRPSVMGYWLLGSTLEYYRVDLVQFATKSRTPLVLLFSLLSLLIPLIYEETWQIHLVLVLYILSGFFSIIILFNWMYQNKPKVIKWLLSLKPTVFIIYAVHAIELIDLGKGLCYRISFLGDLDYFASVHSIIVPIVENPLFQLLFIGSSATVASLCVYCLMNRFVPKFLKLSTGGHA